VLGSAVAKQKTKSPPRRLEKVPVVVVQSDQLKPALKPIVDPVNLRLDRQEALLLEIKRAIATLTALRSRR
jgi:hypothetical protein